MNGYTMLKESYRKLLEQKKISEEEAKKHIRVYEFLENCDETELDILVDSTALNDIIRGYCKLAIEQGSTRGIFDISAEEARGRCIVKETYMDVIQLYCHTVIPEICDSNISGEKEDKLIRTYEFLEKCDEKDLDILVDSSAFNDIIRGYCKLAIVEGSEWVLSMMYAATAMVEGKANE